MATAVGPEIAYPPEFDDRDRFEMTSKGYVCNVTVRSNGTSYLVNFYDPVRLRQDLEAETDMGRPFLAEPGLIVVPAVTQESVRMAVERLWQDGFFAALKPLDR